MYLVYFTILIAAWTCSWFVAYRSFSDHQFLLRRLWSGWHYRLLMVAVLIGAFAAYIISYPVASVVAKEAPQVRPLMDLYVPAEWVVDNTPARGGILRIAGWLGERHRMESSSDFRVERGVLGQSPILSGVSAALLVCVLAIVPPFLLFLLAKARKRMI